MTSEVATNDNEKQAGDENPSPVIAPENEQPHHHHHDDDDDDSCTSPRPCCH